MRRSQATTAPRAWNAVALGVGGFALTRALTLVVAALVGGARLADALDKGDGGWYLIVATNGYDGTLDGSAGNGLSNMAFFPLFPGLIRALAIVGLSPPAAGLLVTFVASLIAAWGLVRFGEQLGSPAAGVLLAVLWGVQPGAVALSMVLSEALFTALAVWAIVHLLRGRLLVASSLCALAGLTRPTGVALGLAVLCVTLPLVVRGDRRGEALAASVIAPLGVAAYLAYVGARLGAWDGYLRVQRQWGSSVDWGATIMAGIGRNLTDWRAPPISVSVLAVLVSVVLLVVLIALRPPLPVVVFAAVAVGLIIVQSNFLASRERFLLVVFPLLWPIARGLERLPRWLAAVILVAAALASARYGSYLLFTWSFAV